MVSDNAKIFKATERELCTLFRHPEVKAELANKGVDWQFNLARAPGGMVSLNGWYKVLNGA